MATVNISLYKVNGLATTEVSGVGGYTSVMSFTSFGFFSLLEQEQMLNMSSTSILTLFDDFSFLQRLQYSDISSYPHKKYFKKP